MPLNDFLLQLSIIEQRLIVLLFDLDQVPLDRIESLQLVLAIGQLSLKCLEIISKFDPGLGQRTLGVGKSG